MTQISWLKLCSEIIAICCGNHIRPIVNWNSKLCSLLRSSESSVTCLKKSEASLFTFMAAASSPIGNHPNNFSSFTFFQFSCGSYVILSEKPDHLDFKLGWTEYSVLTVLMGPKFRVGGLLTFWPEGTRGLSDVSYGWHFVHRVFFFKLILTSEDYAVHCRRDCSTNDRKTTFVNWTNTEVQGIFVRNVTFCNRPNWYDGRRQFAQFCSAIRGRLAVRAVLRMDIKTTGKLYPPTKRRYIYIN